MSSSNIETQIKTSHTTARLLIFGEILFDNFPDGKQVLGGAPFNVAWNLKGLGKDPLMVSSVGDDPSGKRILEQMKRWEMSVEGVQINKALATGEVKVEFVGDEPKYEIKYPRAWDQISNYKYCSSDLIYHGSLALRSDENLKTLGQIISQSKAKRFVDLNVRAPYFDLVRVKEWIKDIEWLKLNKDELALLVGSPLNSMKEYLNSVKQVREIFNVGTVLLTLGSGGALIDGKYGEALVSPAPTPESFVDAVGAGDSLASVMISGIQDGVPAQELLIKASRFASRVCGIQGATSLNRDFYKV